MVTVKTSVLILTLLGAAFACARVAAGADAPEKIMVAGTLIAKDGVPVAGRNVFLFVVSDNQLNLDIKEGKLTNPTATTDAAGKFMIEAAADYVKEDQLFTVGMRSPTGELLVPQRAGASLILKLGKTGKHFALGNLSVEE